MSYLGLLTLLWLLAVPPMCPASRAPVDAVTADTILTSLERATSFLQKRLSEINLDGVVGFRVLEGGCSHPGQPPGRPPSEGHLPALNMGPATYQCPFDALDGKDEGWGGCLINCSRL